MTRYALRRLRHLIVYRVLHADDTPHRIAAGASVGFPVACSPLIGLHMGLSLLGAVIVRGNRAVAVIAAWVSNPITFAPIMAFNWMIGHALMPQSTIQNREEVRLLVRQLVGKAEGLGGLLGRVFEGDFWVAGFQLMLTLGWELWIGSVLVGFVAALLGYLLTYRAVIWRREHRRKRRERRLAKRASDGMGGERSPIAPAGTDKSLKSGKWSAGGKPVIRASADAS